MTDKKPDDIDTQHDLDYVLSDVGEFGRYQIVHFILMILPIVLSATYAVDFIVTSSTDDYRQVSVQQFLSKYVYSKLFTTSRVSLKYSYTFVCFFFHL